ncbi:MAG: hypothetical protein ACOC22_01870 [bacterium]
MKKLFLLLIITMSISFTSCFEEKTNTQRDGERKQEEVMARASQNERVPEVNNFLTRRAVIKWVERMDTPDKLFYIYIVADNGSTIGYFVAQYRPVSTATYLTPPSRVYKHSYGNLSLQSPSLDGTYYGEGGASNQYFFFCAETDAFIELQGLNYILMDQPLKGLNVPRLEVDI